MKRSELYKLNKDELIYLISTIQETCLDNYLEKFRHISVFHAYCCNLCSNRLLWRNNWRESNKAIIIDYKKYHQLSDYRECKRCNKHICKDHEFRPPACKVCGKEIAKDIPEYIVPWVCPKCSKEERKLCDKCEDLGSNDNIKRRKMRKMRKVK